MSRDEMTFELCKQLHEQYAEADNNKTSHIFSFISALTIVFTAYGYAYKELDTNLIVPLSFLVLFVIAALSIIIINYGYSMRRDQFMIAEIREVCMDNIKLKYYLKTINSFDPRCIKNKKCLFNFLPDYYNILFFFTLFIQLSFIVFLLLQRIIEITNLKDFGITIILFVPLLLVILCLIHYYSKYEKRYSNCSKIKFWHKLSLSLLLWAILIIHPLYFYSYYKISNKDYSKEISIKIKVKNKSNKNHETKPIQTNSAHPRTAPGGPTAAGTDGEQQQRR